MHGPINVKSPNNISEWQMRFNSAFKGLILCNGKWTSAAKCDMLSSKSAEFYNLRINYTPAPELRQEIRKGEKCLKKVYCTTYFRIQ